MGCIPSKNEVVKNDISAPLINNDTRKDIEPHSVQPYVVSSSEEDSCAAPIERKNTSQFASNIVNQVTSELIDVPSLAYTLYGSNSPYNYCEEYNSIISAIRIVDGMLNVSLEPDIDPTVPVNELLVTPGHVDYEKIEECGKELDKIVESLKVNDESFVVEF